MRSLADWLEFQQQQHPKSIALGLDRVREVAERMALARPAPVVITVGGTNGKGSTVAFLEAMLRAAGHRVGAYTSPHLLRYNERVRVDGADADDAALCAAFERIEAARGATPLTYFEYGTLAAFDLFARSGVDVAVLEVGLGGRLDAVNLVDADVAIVTTVDVDHVDWLGNDRESIGAEKAGIFRAGRPAIVGDRDPPRALVARALDIGADLRRHGHEFFGGRLPGGGWHWHRAGGSSVVLPEPAQPGLVQIVNASCAIAALDALRGRVAFDTEAIARGVCEARVPGRLQRVSAEPEIVLDVAHNAQAARELAHWLRHAPRKRTFAVFGALADKDVAAIVAALAAHVDRWFLAGLDGATPRGLTARALAERAGNPDPGRVALHEDVGSALTAARVDAANGDRIVVFGSFFVVAAALGMLRTDSESGPPAPL